MMITIPRTTKAVIFDLDGTLIDSERYIWKAMVPVYQNLAPDLTSVETHSFIGKNARAIHRYLVRHHGVNVGFSTYIDRATHAVESVYKKKSALLPGVLTLLAAVHKRGLRTAIASSSPTLWIDWALSRWKLYDSFDIVVSGTELHAPGKPAPDIFLHVARALALHPAACLVFEDSTNGVRAAKAARMMCVGVTNAYQQNDLSEADAHIASFEEVTF